MINGLLVLLEKTEGLMAMHCVGETSPTLLGRTLQGRWELQPELLVGSARREGAERGPEHTRGLQPVVGREAETPAARGEAPLGCRISAMGRCQLFLSASLCSANCQ